MVFSQQPLSNTQPSTQQSHRTIQVSEIRFSQLLYGKVPKNPMVLTNGSSPSLQTLNSFFKMQPQYAKYGNGKQHQARNVVSLLTNTVRVELRDILHILKTIAARPHLLTRDLVRTVYAWMEGSIHHMIVALDILLLEVMDHTAKSVEDMGVLKANKRVLAFGRVKRSMVDLLESEKSFAECLPPGERFEKLCLAAGELRKCVELLAVLDRKLPGLMMEGFSKGELRSFEKTLFSFLAERAGGIEIVDGIMTRWMTKRQTDYMKNRRGMIFSRARVQKARATGGAEYTKLPKEIKRMLDEEKKCQNEMMDVMDPAVQRRLNLAAQNRFGKRFRGYDSMENCDEDSSSSWSDEDEG